MKNILFLLFVSLVFSSCSGGPEPIRFGHDSCDRCKMVIMDPKFGAEIVTAKGKVYKLDDVNCMVGYMRGLKLESKDIGHLLIVDFGNPESLINVEDAYFIHSDKIRSPMASEIAAFSDKALMEKYYAEWGGEILDWKGVKKLFE